MFRQKRSNRRSPPPPRKLMDTLTLTISNSIMKISCDRHSIGYANTFKPPFSPKAVLLGNPHKVRPPTNYGTTSSLVSGVRTCLLLSVAVLISRSVLYFYLARASPLRPTRDVNSAACGFFVSQMLQESGDGDSKRPILEMSLRNILHPEFEPLGTVVESLRDYLLGIPWQKMEDEDDFPVDLRLHPAHAAVVMRRMLLATLTDPSLQSILDIELQTAAPRNINIFGNPFAQQTTKISAGLKQHTMKPSSSSVTSSSSSLKRKLSSSSLREPAGKRPRSQSSRPDTQHTARPSSDTQHIARPGSDTQHTARPGLDTQHTARPGSVLDLSQKIWKDQMWYSGGQLRQGSAATPADTDTPASGFGTASLDQVVALRSS